MLSAHTQPDAESLRREIERTRALTDLPFGVNLILAWDMRKRLESAGHTCPVHASLLAEVGRPIEYRYA